MPLVEDQAIYPTLIALAACLCEEMEKAGGPSLCYCGIIAGEPAMDFCGGGCDGNGCGGQAWVRLVDAFPSSTFPNPEATLANCWAPMAYNIEIGVARCAPMGENGVNGYVPPTQEENIDAIRLQTADIAALRRAVQCCFGGSERDYILGTYSQLPVNGGGCVGGVFTVTAWQEF